jgi:tripartite-type tricarboxylate transporter receptor subunit TctC
MLLNRRKMMKAIAGATALAAAPPALAQDSKDLVTFVSAFPPGSGADILVRFWAQKLGPIVGSTIIVQNKPGAMGFIAAEYTARSKPDGHTIFVHAGTSIAGNMHVFKNPPLDVTKELKVATTLSRHSYMWLSLARTPHTGPCRS